MLYSNLLVQTGYMIQYGLFIFIFFQAFLLSARFSNAFETVELQHRRLEDTNAAYEKEIMERQRTEEALRESEEKYRALLENASDAIVVARDEMLCFVNSRAVELSGYSEKELKSNPFITLIHPQDRDMVQHNQLQMLSSKPMPEGNIFKCLHKDGSIKWVETSAVRISWEGVPATLNFLRDITEKHRLKEELLKAQKLEAIGVIAGGFRSSLSQASSAFQIRLLSILTMLGESMVVCGSEGFS